MGFHREPALLALPVLTTILAVVSQWAHWNPATTATVLAIVVALGAVLTAALTRPWHPSAVTAAVGGVLTLVSHVWLHWDASTIAAAAVTGTLAIALVLRHQITPVVPPA